MSIGSAIRTIRVSIPMTQTELVAKVNPKTSTVKILQDVLSRFETGEKTPTPDDLAALEDAMNIPRGRILITAGYVLEIGSVPAAIAADSALNEEGRQSMLLTYRAVAHYLTHGGPP
jgi:transcriptional regulator with XRE-family HTH domain